jgi:hypothetical protein
MKTTNTLTDITNTLTNTLKFTPLLAATTFATTSINPAYAIGGSDENPSQAATPAAQQAEETKVVRDGDTCYDVNVSAGRVCETTTTANTTTNFTPAPNQPKRVCGEDSSAPVLNTLYGSDANAPSGVLNPGSWECRKQENSHSNAYFNNDDNVMRSQLPPISGLCHKPNFALEDLCYFIPGSTNGGMGDPGNDPANTQAANTNPQTNVDQAGQEQEPAAPAAIAWKNFGIQTVNEGETLEINLNDYLASGEALGFSVRSTTQNVGSGLPDYVTIHDKDNDHVNETIVISPNYETIMSNKDGSDSITLGITALAYESEQDESGIGKPFNVTVKNTNRAPTLIATFDGKTVTNSSTVYIKKDETKQLELIVSDLDLEDKLSMTVRDWPGDTFGSRMTDLGINRSTAKGRTSPFNLTKKFSPKNSTRLSDGRFDYKVKNGDTYVVSVQGTDGLDKTNQLDFKIKIGKEPSSSDFNPWHAGLETRGINSNTGEWVFGPFVGYDILSTNTGSIRTEAGVGMHFGISGSADHQTSTTNDDFASGSETITQDIPGIGDLIYQWNESQTVDTKNIWETPNVAVNGQLRAGYATPSSIPIGAFIGGSITAHNGQDVEGTHHTRTVYEASGEIVTENGDLWEEVGTSTSDPVYSKEAVTYRLPGSVAPGLFAIGEVNISSTKLRVGIEYQFNKDDTTGLGLYSSIGFNW